MSVAAPQLSRAEMAQVRDRMLDPEFHRSMAEMVGRAYAAYTVLQRRFHLAFAMTPGSESADKAFAFTREVGATWAPHLAIASGLLEVAEQHAMRVPLQAPPEASDPLAALTEVFRALSQVDDLDDLERIVQEMPSAGELYVRLTDSPAMLAWFETAGASLVPPHEVRM